MLTSWLHSVEVIRINHLGTMNVCTQLGAMQLVLLKMVSQFKLLCYHNNY